MLAEITKKNIWWLCGWAFYSLWEKLYFGAKNTVALIFSKTLIMINFSLKNIFKKKFFFYWYFIKNVKKILGLYIFFSFSKLTTCYRERKSCNTRNMSSSARIWIFQRILSVFVYYSFVTTDFCWFWNESPSSQPILYVETSYITLHIYGSSWASYFNCHITAEQHAARTK